MAVHALWVCESARACGLVAAAQAWLTPLLAAVMDKLNALTPPLSQAHLQELSPILQETALACGHQRLAVTLSKVPVTGATSSALSLPSQPLKPLSNIAPNPHTPLKSPDERKIEIDAQARANFHHRSLPLDEE